MHDPFAPGGSLVPHPRVDGLFTGRLANGMRYVIREDHRTAVAVCNVWVPVGSNREPEALRGWSHGIEHMLFKGTPRRGEGDFATEVAAAGGSTNAGTGYETTNYHITIPAANLAVAVDILADALFASEFAPESLDAERQVLVHENHMYDDIPFGFGVTWRWGTELAYDISPYRHPIGGRDENLLQRSREEIMDFWRSAYRPESMVAVIVGDVHAAAARDLLEERFGSVTVPERLDPATSVVAEPPVEPPHDGARMRLETGELKKAYAKLIFPAPGEREGLDAIQGVVRRVLGDGRSCRLYRRIQEEAGLVDDFAVLSETGPREGLVLIDIETDTERLAEALCEVTGLLAELRRDSCSDEELARAARRTARGHLFGAETVQGQAANLGHHAVLDDLDGALDFPARVAAVSRDDVAAWCRRVFRLDELSCVLYLPEGTETAACGLPADAAGLTSLLEPVLGQEPPALELAAPEPEAAAVILSSAPTTERQASFVSTRLACGARLHVRRDSTLPVAAMAFTARGGATDETAGEAGLAALTAATMVKGAGDLNARSLHEQLEGEGGSLGPHSDRDYNQIFATALSARLDPVLELATRVLAAPQLAEAEVEQEKRLARQQLAAIADSPLQTAAVRLRALMFGDHPYGRPLPGLDESLASLTREQIRRRWERMWTRAGLEITVSGDVDPDVLARKLDGLLADLPAGEAAAATPDPGPAVPYGGVVSDSITRQQNQAVVLVGWPAPGDDDTDRVPLMLLRGLLNGQSGRLFEQLRNRRSLCYNCGAMSSSGFGPGMFVGYVLTAPESAATAREELVRELAETTTAVADRDEFERVRAELTGSLLIGSQANSARVARAARDLVYGRDANDLPVLIERIKACEPDAVRAAAARIIDPERRFEVTVAP